MAFPNSLNLSEDELIAFLCGEFGGISRYILQEAMNITPLVDIESESQLVESCKDTKMPEHLAKTDDVSVFPSQANTCRDSTGIENADETLVAVIDSVLVAVELERMSKDVGPEVGGKAHGGIALRCGWS